jgi:hypothetical protein
VFDTRNHPNIVCRNPVEIAPFKDEALCNPSEAGQFPFIGAPSMLS